MEYAVNVQNVSKKYTLYKNQREKLLDFVWLKNYGEDFFALRDINFTAKKGETIGFIGINGSGKSTLLNIIAGIVPETSGQVEVNGETSIIAVATGLKENLTGRENIEMKCLMLGFSKNEIQEMEPDIIEFSELGKFIDQPVKSYSSGMKSRLGFAISVTVNPDILIIDEALSVGDQTFAQKCLDKINSFKKEGKTILFVSHSLNQMKAFCDKLYWLEFGREKMFGPANEVAKAYEAFLTEYKKMTKQQKDEYRRKKEEPIQKDA